MGSKVVLIPRDQPKWERIKTLPGLKKGEEKELAGIESAVLRTDDQTGAMTTLLRYDPGYIEPKQRHSVGHAGYVLRGAIYNAETGQLLVAEGDYWYAPAGDVHGPFAFAPDTLVLFITDGPFDFYIVRD